jgi:hypothetical protein
VTLETADDEATPADDDGGRRPQLHEHLSSRRERVLFALAGFAATIAISRAVTGLLHARGAGGSGGIVVAGVHVHHFVFGIALLVGTGFSWLLLGGIDDQARRWFRITAVAFGVGTGLVFDEFALWLNLQDVYWQQRGRQSIEAIAVVVALLALGLLVRPFGRARWKARATRRKR